MEKIRTKGVIVDTIHEDIIACKNDNKNSNLFLGVFFGAVILVILYFLLKT